MKHKFALFLELLILLLFVDYLQLKIPFLNNAVSESVSTDPCDNKENSTDENLTEETISENSAETLINPEGPTLEERILTPKGYYRQPVDADSLTFFLRNYPMKIHGSPILLYNGEPAKNQTAHSAIFALPLESEDFQQCADSVMRVYAEYYLSIRKPEKIAFHFTTGFLAEYSMWRDGYRIKADESDFCWVQSDGYDDSYQNFTKYMRMVFAYANTLSMDTYEAEPISLRELRVGDVFLEGGSPGHVILVVDVCSDENGRRAFLLAQGHMPAQEFELMKNPAHENDPWYYEEEIVFPFDTSVHTFSEDSLQRLCYFP